MTEIVPGMFVDDWNGGLTHAPETSFCEFVLGGDEDPDAPRMYYARIEADQSGPRHAHAGWTINVVLQGNCRMGDIDLNPGQVLTCAPNIQYGPLMPGPEGVTILEIFDSALARRPIWADPESPDAKAYEEWLTNDLGDWSAASPPG